MSNISIVFTLGVPTKGDAGPEKKASPETSIQTKVRQRLELMECGHATPSDWRAMRSFYLGLMRKKKQTDETRSLIALIKPVMQRYGYHD